MASAATGTAVELFWEGSASREPTSEGIVRLAGLIGREQERAWLRASTGRGTGQGPAVLLGAAGMGKTALLDASRTEATAAGTPVLRINAVLAQDEVAVVPGRDFVRRLPPDFGAPSVLPRRGSAPTDSANVGAGPGLRTLRDAVLELLRLAGQTRGMLLQIDDVDLLDPSSAMVLVRAARDAARHGVRLVVTASAAPAVLAPWDDIRILELPGLDERSADRLVSSRDQQMAWQPRRSVVEHAGGNPLALRELTSALDEPHRRGVQPLPDPLPCGALLSNRLVPGLESLPASTRRLLLPLALESTVGVDVLQRWSPGTAVLKALGPAQAAGLLEVDEAFGTVQFVADQLCRSAVAHTYGDDERRAAHHALAESLTDEDRRLQHAAAASASPDDGLADRLDTFAERLLAGGNARGAISAQLRAAELSSDAGSRAHRLGRAASISADVTGDLAAAQAMLGEVGRSGSALADVTQAVEASLDLQARGRVGGAADDRTGLFKALGAASVGGACSTALRALVTVLSLQRDAGGQAAREAVAARAVKVDESLSLAARLYLDPAHARLQTLERLDEVTGLIGRGLDPGRVISLGQAALYVDRLAQCRQGLIRVSSSRTCAPQFALQARVLLAFDAWASGQWTQAALLSSEVIEDAALAKCLPPIAGAWYCRGLVAAARGEDADVHAAVEELRGRAAAQQADGLLHQARHVLALAAAGGRDFPAAFEHASVIGAAGHFPRGRPEALWVLLELAEGAVRTNRVAAAEGHGRTARRLGLAAVSPRLALCVSAVEALASEGPQAAEALAALLTMPNLIRFPFDLARAHLLMAQLLREKGDVLGARHHGVLSLDAFRRLDAAPWVARSAAALRAVGHVASTVRPAPRALLSEEDLRVVELAAAGLTNKEIGSRLYLSHRTVAARLHRVFPLLGVASRAGLRDALEMWDA